MSISIKNLLLFGISSLVMLVLIAMTSRKHEDRKVNDLAIQIIEQEGNFFIDQFEVTALINAENTDYVLGLNLDQLDLKELERRVEQNAFVRDAQVFLDIKGNLNVRIEQARPIARIFNPDGSSKYIDDNGDLLPLNARHTARVPIVEFDRKIKWKENVSESEFGQDLLALLAYVHEHPFWQAQIAQIIVDKNEDLTFIPQVTSQRVVFGDPADFEDKLDRLKLFYTEILPAKGWNTYEYVNVKYNNQIVCK